MARHRSQPRGRAHRPLSAHPGASRDPEPHPPLIIPESDLKVRVPAEGGEPVLLNKNQCEARRWTTAFAGDTLEGSAATNNPPLVIPEARSAIRDLLRDHDTLPMGPGSHYARPG